MTCTCRSCALSASWTPEELAAFVEEDQLSEAREVEAGAGHLVPEIVAGLAAPERPITSRLDSRVEGLARALGLTRDAVWKRIQRGWPPEKIVAFPSRRRAA